MQDKLKESLFTGFINKQILSDVAFQPELLVNQKTPPKKILSTIIRELSSCDEFYISVAFVTTSGIATIINQLKELEERGVKGYVLVSQYLNFTQPEALKRLMQFSNIELRILTSENAHAKGYIFKTNSHYNLIVGSSNLTANALSTNKEWNIKVSALDNSGLVYNVLEEFNKDFAKATVVTIEFINQYNDIYKKQKVLNKGVLQEEDSDFNPVIPNVMQEEALLNLTNLRAQLKNKALIISATGTGKTYLSAFDAKAFNPNKLLFVVHRRTIAEDAMKTFKKVFGTSKSMGLYSGNTKELQCDFIFSTIQTISKSEHLNQFHSAYFDYIIIDETHRSAAESYTRLLNYFQPKFLLGMTATPERTDGNNIFEQFDYNIAYEIRLNRAMEEEMLSSFHYYGVTDLIIDDQVIENKSDFNLLVSEERINRIIEQAQFYGCDNGILRGLIFCSRKEEAKELSRLLNEKGLKTKALTGDSSEDERAKAIEDLSSDDLNNKLDYIITVDIFNEGIDIPKINQIIMLRPTESAIIFIQQLGRGLRKVEGKGYLTVIDFIGNYENNYLIPIALYGDTSYNKDTIRKLITEGSRMIPGSSTINFDPITKERIFQSIDSANMKLLVDLKKDYTLLKYRLGRVPMMMDFLEHNARDPYVFVEYAKSYYNFVKKIEKDNIENLNNQEIELLELFSKEINNGKRVLESIILQRLINRETVTLSVLNEFLMDKYSFGIDIITFNSCINNINFSFVRKEKNIIELNNNNVLKFSLEFSSLLKNVLFSNYLIDNITYGIHIYDGIYNSNLYKDGFILFQKYSRKDVCRILNWNLNEEATVYGYKFNNNTCPIFVNYHKEDNIASSTKFPEKFLNVSQFLWYSKPNRKLTSNDILKIRKQEKNLRLPFFVKKHNGEGSDFYYMGDVKPIDNSFEQTTIKNDSNEDVDVVKVVLELYNPVDISLYNYITSNEILEKNVDLKLETEFDNDLENDVFEEELKIPLFNFYAAAGSFSDLQSDHEFSLIDAPENIQNTKDYFACKIIGDSMDRVIPNGSIALFKHYTGGSRNGKIVLVENRDIQDEDFNSAFTIKTYSSEKEVTEEGWSHTIIKLLPNSYDDSYSPIIITEENGEQMKIIGEFVALLS